MVGTLTEKQAKDDHAEFCHQNHSSQQGIEHLDAENKTELILVFVHKPSTTANMSLVPRRTAWV